MITLIIKGDRFAASQAVTDRRIVVFARPAVQINDYSWRIDAVDSELEKIAAWFAEPSELIKGKGYPDGTLLIYSFHDQQ